MRIGRRLGRGARRIAANHANGIATPPSSPLTRRCVVHSAFAALSSRFMVPCIWCKRVVRIVCFLVSSSFSTIFQFELRLLVLPACVPQLMSSRLRMVTLIVFEIFVLIALSGHYVLPTIAVRPGPGGRDSHSVVQPGLGSETGRALAAEAVTAQSQPFSASTSSSAMPSLFSLADQQDLPRSMTKCPPEIRVNEWNGRIGNHYFQVSQAVVAALLCHITHVKFPPHIYMQVGGRNYQQQDGLLDMPEDLTLPAGLRRHEDLNIPISCPMYNNHTWYQHHCRMVPAWHHRQVMKAFLRPYLGKTLANLVQAPRDVGTDRVLTIHLRADDVHRWNKGEYEWGQPPCSMYQKIIAEFGYRSMQIVAKTNPVTRRSDAACDGWLVDYGRAHGIGITRPSDMTLAGEAWRNKVWQVFETAKDGRPVAFVFVCPLGRKKL